MVQQEMVDVVVVVGRALQVILAILVILLQAVMQVTPVKAVVVEAEDIHMAHR